MKKKGVFYDEMEADWLGKLNKQMMGRSTSLSRVFLRKTTWSCSLFFKFFKCSTRVKSSKFFDLTASVFFYFLLLDL